MIETSPLLFSETADRLRPRIEAALQARVRPADGRLSDGCPAVLREAMAYSLLAPGKRLRPMLVLMAAEACGGNESEAMPAACAVEMVHAYSLVHDDLPAMDDDDLRRGQPTCHKRFGEAVAILAGDARLTMALEVLARDIEPPEVAARCCAALARAAGPCGMVGGQADDMNRGAVSGSAGYDETGINALESIHLRKTGALICASLRLGALAARADAGQIEALERYGRCLGLAFQITDDLLDVCSDVQTVGKRVGKDANQGKLTFPGLLGLDRSRDRARELIDEACEAIVPLGTQARSMEALGRFVLERNR